MKKEWMTYLTEFFKKIESGLDTDFMIYGYTFSFMDLFVWGALGSILIGFLVGVIRRD